MTTNNSINSNIPIGIAKGGTNATSMATSYGVAYFDGSKIVTVASVGTSSQALTSTGVASAPTFQAFSPSGGVTTSSVGGYLASNLALTKNIRYSVALSERFDVGNDYSGTDFTVPLSGYYLASSNVLIRQDSGPGSSETFGIQGWTLSGADNRGPVVLSFNHQQLPGFNEMPSPLSPYTDNVSKASCGMIYADAADIITLDVEHYGIDPGPLDGQATASSSASYGSLFLVGT